MRDDERDKLKDSGYCEHGNKPSTCLVCKKREEQEGEIAQQEQKVGQAKSMIESIGGTIDSDTRPFKQFDEKNMNGSLFKKENSRIRRSYSRSVKQPALTDFAMNPGT